MDIQPFTESGTWTKPPGATYVDLLLKGAGGGGAFGVPGEDGALTVRRLPAGELPDQCEVTIGRGGRGADGGGDGADGYAVFITHLTTAVD
jgi:hypothetical protein